MNYLAHLYLAELTGTSPAGSILGDAVKGRLRGDYPAEVELGVRLHRSVDSFTDRHPVMLAACARFKPPYRRYAGILVDVYFDHLLAIDWARWHDAQLADFARNISRRMREEWPHPPFTRTRIAHFPQLLCSYREPRGLSAAFEHIDARARRVTPLPHALPAVRRWHHELRAEFDVFFPDLHRFALQETRRLRG